VVYLRPVKRARVTNVPNSASKRSRRGATATRLKIMWKKLRCVRGNRLSRCTAGIAVSFGGSLAGGSLAVGSFPLIYSGVDRMCRVQLLLESPRTHGVCIWGTSTTHPGRRNSDNIL
jgi:hypothetical protein